MGKKKPLLLCSNCLDWEPAGKANGMCVSDESPYAGETTPTKGYCAAWVDLGALEDE